MPCGGGVTFQPCRAIASLKNKYGIDGLKGLCLDLLFGNPAPPGHAEGIPEVAQGILYHLADTELLKELTEIRHNLVAEQGKHQPGESSAGRLRDMETLIGGICNKLDLPCPADVPSLHPQIEHHLFRQEQNLSSNRSLWKAR